MVCFVVNKNRVVKFFKPEITVAKIEIDTSQCIAVAEEIKHKGGVPKDTEDPMPYSFPKRIAQNGWWAICAINQQTTPVRGKAVSGIVDGKTLFGWDYLLQKAIVLANEDSKMFTRSWLCSVTPEVVREMYHDETYGDTLNQIETRATLLRDLGEFLVLNNWETIQEAYRESHGYITKSDGRGLGQILSEARAYQDPVQKKLFYLLAIMQNQGFWKYKDILNLSSPVNYHEQRGHLRLGTVIITDSVLERKIRNRRNITDQEDIEIRFAVRRAIEFIAQYLSVTPSMMHYYFWNFFRNCCKRENPHCETCGNTCSLPERYSENSSERCVFASVCPSANLDEEERLIEPRIDETIWQ